MVASKRRADVMRFSTFLIGVLICAGALAACGDPQPGADDTDAAPSTIDVQDSSDAADVGCSEVRRKEDGTCCPFGSFYQFDSDTCVAVGPAECAESALINPASCVPRWCGKALAKDKKDAPAGLVSAVACSEAGSINCPAGQFPAGDGSCKDPPFSVPRAPKQTLLPALQNTSFCLDDGDLVPCDVGPCGTGTMPATNNAAGCMSVGISFYCPTGFLPKGGNPISTPNCTPDPAGCGLPNDLTKTAIYADASAWSGGDGSAGKPFKTIAAAIKAAPTGGTVVLRNSFKESVVLPRSMKLIGECAAKAAWAPKYVVGTTSPALVIHGKGVQVELVGVRFVGTGAGVRVSGGAVASLSRLAMGNLVGYGVYALGAGTTVRMRDCTVRHVSSSGSATGFGIGVAHGARLELDDVDLYNNRALGVVVEKAGSSLVARGLRIGNTGPTAIGELGIGLLVRGGASATVQSAFLRSNRAAGVLVMEKGSSLDMSASMVSFTLPETKGQTGGFGMRIESGAKVKLHGVRVHGNRTIGVDVFGPGASLQANGLLIDATREQYADKVAGAGLRVQSGANADIVGLRSSVNRTAGVVIYNADLRLRRALIDKTLPRVAGNKDGVGLTLNGGSATLTDVRIADNRRLGLEVRPGRLVARNLAVESSLGINKTWGNGIEVAKGGSLTMHNAVIGENLTAGLVVTGKGSTLEASGLRLRGTGAQGSDSKHGWGLVVSHGAKASVAGAVVSHNRRTGVAVAHAGSSLKATGMRIVDTQIDLGHSGYGLGLMATTGAGPVDVRRSIIAANHAIGAYIHKSSASLTGVVVAKTVSALFSVGESGDKVEIADGVVLLDASKVSIVDSLITGHGRVGLLARNSSKVTLKTTAIDANELGMGLDNTVVAATSVMVKGGKRDRNSATKAYAPTPPGLVQVASE